jgi:NAD(P)-dependent dehydrogenase (short-subunit alcohol dehydrogenase family)
MAGKVAMPFLSSYCASKFALEGLADVMRAEVRRWGVDIVVVEPGGIRTGMVRDQIRSVGERKAALVEPERSHYGHLYQGFETLCVEGQKTSAEPVAIAEILVSAIEAEKPDTRYVAGADAKGLIDMCAAMSDRERDVFFDKVYGIAPPA